MYRAAKLYSLDALQRACVRVSHGKWVIADEATISGYIGNGHDSIVIEYVSTDTNKVFDSVR